MAIRMLGIVVGGMLFCVCAIDALAEEPLQPPALILADKPPPPPAPVGGPAESAWEAYNEPPDGVFGAIDAQLLKPHLKYRLAALMDFGALGIDVVRLPAAGMDWVVAPRIELGYRMPEGMGGFIFAYRPLTTEGNANLLGFGVGGVGLLHSRLDQQVVDFDWTSKEWTVAELLKVQWRLGARFATIYADSAATDGTVFQHSSNYFYGFGPHVGLDLWEPLPIMGLGLFVRAEAATLAGRINQTFEEVVELQNGPAGSGNNFHKTRSVPTVSLEAGLSWSSAIFAPERVTFTAGYAFEKWWYIGNLTSNLEDNKAGLWSQGLFFRGEWRY